MTCKMAFKFSAGHDLARWTWPVALMDESVPFSACDLTKSQQLYKTARVILGMTQYSIIKKYFCMLMFLASSSLLDFLPAVG